MSGYYAEAYNDDGFVMITRKFIGVACECMQTVYNIIEQMDEETGFSLNLDKTDLTHFKHKIKLTKIKPPTNYGKSLT